MFEMTIQGFPLIVYGDSDFSRERGGRRFDEGGWLPYDEKSSLSCWSLVVRSGIFGKRALGQRLTTND
jgi:hypothetical protein